MKSTDDRIEAERHAYFQKGVNERDQKANREVSKHKNYTPIKALGTSVMDFNAHTICLCCTLNKQIAELKKSSCEALEKVKQLQQALKEREDLDFRTSTQQEVEPKKVEKLNAAVISCSKDITNTMKVGKRDIAEVADISFNTGAKRKKAPGVQLGHEVPEALEQKVVETFFRTETKPIERLNQVPDKKPCQESVAAIHHANADVSNRAEAKPVEALHQDPDQKLLQEASASAAFYQEVGDIDNEVKSIETLKQVSDEKLRHGADIGAIYWVVADFLYKRTTTAIYEKVEDIVLSTEARPGALHQAPDEMSCQGLAAAMYQEASETLRSNPAAAMYRQVADVLFCAEAKAVEALHQVPDEKPRHGTGAAIYQAVADFLCKRTTAPLYQEVADILLSTETRTLGVLHQDPDEKLCHELAASMYQEVRDILYSRTTAKMYSNSFCFSFNSRL